MASETPMLDIFAAELVGKLTSVLPADWSIRDAEEKSDRSIGIVLYYEQGDIVTDINNTPVPVGFVGVEYTLTLAAPETDPAAGTNRVTKALLELLPALDGLERLAWDRAEKVRLTSGETCYRLPIVNLCRYANPTP